MEILGIQEEVKGEIKVGDYIMDVNNALLDQDLHESKVKSITKLEEQTVYHFGVDGSLITSLQMV